MEAITVTGTHISMFRKTNTWYTIKDGNWNDPSVWVSNGRKKYTCPQMGDDVFVGHNITFNILVLNLKNLCISGSLTFDSSGDILTINGNLQCTGSLDLSAGANTIVLNGYNNFVVQFSSGTLSTFQYSGMFDQEILNLSYRNLNTTGGTKYQKTDIIVDGIFNPQSDYECGIYNLTVNGNSTIGTASSPFTFSKNSSIGKILFVGSVDFEGIINLSGNPNLEFKNGLTIHTFSLNTGSGTFTFSTNNQTINCLAYLGGNWNAPVVVSGSITLTLSGGFPLQLNSTLNGTVSSSTFNNSGILYLGLNNTPMITGIFNYQYSPTSTLGYIFNGNYTLPYTSYANLVIDGTGTKTQGGNTIIGQSLLVRASSSGCIYECNGYNLTVNTTFTNQGSFKANSSCNILLIGLASLLGVDSVGFDLSIGNPNIEFRGGLTIHCQNVKTGTGTFKFSTNNQTIDFNIINNGNWNANILISGTTTVTFLDGVFGSAQYYVNGNLNGDSSNSIFINGGTFTYLNGFAPMTTGKLYCNQLSNTFIYGASGNQDISTPADPIPGYQNLILNGSGAKKLTGNVSVKGTFTISNPATLNSNGFTLTNP